MGITRNALQKQVENYMSNGKVMIIRLIAEKMNIRQYN